MKLYLVAHETDLFGTWSSPEQAVKDHLGITDNLEIEKTVKEMLSPYSDYPVLVELEAGIKFTMSR